MRRFQWLFILNLAIALLRYFITRSRFGFSNAGDNLLLRNASDRGRFDWPRCLSAGRFRPATYCDLSLQLKVGLFDNWIAEALVFSLVLAACVVTAWKICEVIVGRAFVCRNNAKFIVFSSVFLCFSPVWSYSVLSDFANMELFGTFFFLLSLLFQCRAVATRRLQALSLSVVFALCATLWHERYVATMLACAVVWHYVARPDEPSGTRRTARISLVAAPFALTVAYLVGRRLFGNGLMISYGGESPTSLSSIVSESGLRRVILTAGLSFSPAHFTNYNYMGSTRTPTLTMLAVLSALSFCFLVVSPLIRAAWQEERSRSAHARRAVQVLIINLAPLILFLASVEERLELRWLAASSALTIPLVTVGIARVWATVPRRRKPLFPIVVVGAILIALVLAPNRYFAFEVGSRLNEAAESSRTNVPICLAPEVSEGWVQWVTGYGLLGNFVLTEGPPCLEVRVPKTG